MSPESLPQTLCADKTAWLLCNRDRQSGSINAMSKRCNWHSRRQRLTGNAAGQKVRTYPFKPTQEEIVLCWLAKRVDVSWCQSMSKRVSSSTPRPLMLQLFPVFACLPESFCSIGMDLDAFILCCRLLVSMCQEIDEKVALKKIEGVFEHITIAKAGKCRKPTSRSRPHQSHRHRPKPRPFTTNMDEQIRTRVFGRVELGDLAL